MTALCHSTCWVPWVSLNGSQGHVDCRTAAVSRCMWQVSSDTDSSHSSLLLFSQWRLLDTSLLTSVSWSMMTKDQESESFAWLCNIHNTETRVYLRRRRNSLLTFYIQFGQEKRKEWNIYHIIKHHYGYLSQRNSISLHIPCKYELAAKCCYNLRMQLWNRISKLRAIYCCQQTSHPIQQMLKGYTCPHGSTDSCHSKLSNSVLKAWKGGNLFSASRSPSMRLICQLYPRFVLSV
jgi:hypothetical protein